MDGVLLDRQLSRGRREGNRKHEILLRLLSWRRPSRAEEPGFFVRQSVRFEKIDDRRKEGIRRSDRAFFRVESVVLGVPIFAAEMDPLVIGQDLV